MILSFAVSARVLYDRDYFENPVIHEFDMFEEHSKLAFPMVNVLFFFSYDKYWLFSQIAFGFSCM